MGRRRAGSREKRRRTSRARWRGIVTELAEGSRAPEIARIHARRVLEDDVRGTIKRVATKLYLLADADEDGQVSLPELAGLFDVVRSAPDAETLPQPPALAGSLQLLPPSESAAATSAADRSTGVAYWRARRRSYIANGPVRRLLDCGHRPIGEL